MPKFALEWTVQGSAVIEADDADEAERILHDCLGNFDTSMMEEFDVLETTTDSVDGVDYDEE
jgi:hypothetical protein